MENLFFKCSCCKNIIRMEKKTKEHFANWAYYVGVEWSDYGEDIPDFSKEDWIRSETSPVVNENRTLHVCKPFDESIGNEFLALFEPALVYFNGWDDMYKDDIEKCAIVRCRLMKILSKNEYEAWIVVNVQEVLPVNELCKYFKPCIADMDITVFKGIPEKICKTVYKNDKWLVTCWDAQGDCGEYKWIYTDENGIRHLVMESWFDFDNSVVYVGNIIEKDNGISCSV